ncbi:MAG: aryl-sulfate sulfotransferase [Spirochaetota bacterium]
MAYIRELTRDVEVHDPSKAYEGYTLFAPMFGNIAWLVDMNGKVVHYWEFKNITTNHARLTPRGTILWPGRGPEAIQELASNCTELVEKDWEGNEVWRYDDQYLNHDFLVLDNGNLLLLRYTDMPDELQKKVKGGIPGTEIDGKIYGISLHEITRDKQVVWEWNNYQHLDPEKDMADCLDPRYTWGYSNSIDVFPNGDVLISMRHFNTLARIDKKTGEITWRWGPEHLLGHQHSVSVLENGNILCFDNGLHRKWMNPGDPIEIGTAFEASRVIEIDMNTGEIVWEYIDPQHLMYTNICGSAERLANGNTLLCESKRGVFYEVTPEKEIVWKYRSPFVVPRPAYFGWVESKLVFQAHRYGTGFKGFEGKTLDPDNFEWVIRRKPKEAREEEEKIKQRLSRLGY